MNSVAIIVPVKNSAAYLHEALKSIEDQTFRDYHVYIIDDGSTDSSFEICSAQARSDARFSVHRNISTGIVSALNLGIKISSEPMIARMDADDIALEKRLEKQFVFMQNRKNVSIVGTQVLYVSNNHTIGKSNFPTSVEETRKRLVRKGCALSHPTIMIRRAAIDAVGGYRRSLEGAEDYDLYLRVIEKHAITNLPDVLLKYRMHEHQYSNTNLRKQRLARDLALLSFRCRAAGEQDPLEEVKTNSSTNAGRESGDIAARRVQKILRAHSIISKVEEKNKIYLREFLELAWAYSGGYLGDGKRARRAIIRNAFKSIQWRLSAEIS